MTYKVFESGETLTANDVQTYFMDQVVIHVANESDLTTLINDHPEVRVAYAQDTDKVYALVSGVWEPLAYEGGDFTFDDLTVTGNLTVTGTTTSVDSTTIQVKDSFVFEGLTPDAYETTLQVAEPTADRTITLPDSTGTVALTSDLPTLNGLLPSQTNNSGKYLTTDGTDSSWASIAGYALPSQSGNGGKYLTTDGTNEFWGTVSQYALPSQSGNGGKLLTTNGTNESWSALTLDELQIQQVMDYL